MSHLLDTHAFLWAAFSPRKLGHRARAAMVDPENIVLVSAVSFWEISLKCALGKIEIKGASPEDLPGVARAMGFDLLPLDSETASTFFKLPREEHRDPFDRMLVWQAIRAELTLVTKDPGMAAYADQGLALLW